MAHEPSGVDLRARGNDFGLSDTLLLCGGGERGRNLGVEDDVLDEDTLDGNTPFVGDVSDNFSDFECDGLAFGDDALDGAGANDVPEGCLGTLDESLAQIGDTEGGAIGVANLEVNNRVTVIDK